MKNIFFIIVLILIKTYPGITGPTYNKDSLYFHLTNYLFLKGEINKNDTTVNGNYKKLFHVQEIIEEDENISKNKGIYRFQYVGHEDSNYNFFIKDGNSIEIYDIASLGFFLTKVIYFLESNEDHFNKNSSFEYIKKIIYIYEETYKSDFKSVKLQYNFNNYKYFLTPVEP